MKRENWVRLIAVILVISMLAAPVSAVTIGGTVHSNNGLIGIVIGIIRDIIRDIFDDWFDKPGTPEPTVPVAPTEPPVPTTPVDPTVPSEPVVTDPTDPTEPVVTDPTDPSEPEDPVTEGETILELVEDNTTTENGHLLRGVTYSLSQVLAEQEQEKSDPYTVKDYVNSNPSNALKNPLRKALSNLLNAFTPQAVGDKTLVEVTSVDAFDGTKPYIIVSERSENGGLLTTETYTATISWSSLRVYGLKTNGTVSADTTELWTITPVALNTYTIKHGDQYLTLDYSFTSTASLTDNVSQLGIERDGDYWYIKNGDGDYLSNVGGFGNGYYGASGFNEKDGSGWKIYEVVTETAPEPTDPPETTEPSVDPEEPEDTTKLVYFPVTMFDYNADTLNTVTLAMDGVDANHPYNQTALNGLYFSNGGSELTWNETSTEVGIENYTDGQYYIQNMRAKDNGVASWLYYNASGSNRRYINSTTQENATLWTLTNKGNNQVTLSFKENGITYYMTVGDTTSGVTTTETLLTLVGYSHSIEGIQILGDEYLCQFGSNDATVFGGYEQPNDQGNGMSFYRVTDGVVSTTPVTTPPAEVVFLGGHAVWNWWGYRSEGNSAQNKFYTGLVQKELNVDKDIVFNINEPGIFKTGTGENIADKSVYEYVGLPFVLNDKGYYTFDSDANGVYFKDLDNDGDADPASGTEAQPNLMAFDYGRPQGWDNMDFGDDSSNLWAPYNTQDEASDGYGATNNNIDYHFGMRADIPFSMTPNGCIKSTDNNSDHITFTFAGDDDVWIFIDGHLVIDLGGIHNRIGATIDFAANTITYFRPESNTKNLPIGSFNDSENYVLNEDGTITVKLYNEGSEEGALGQTRTDFASNEKHEMTIFYLERGKGTSNCKIEFNMPMRDTVSITKDATKSWSQAQDDIDNEGDGTISLTAKEQAAVNKLNFGFTLFKKTAEDEDFAPVINTNFYVQDKDGNVLSIQSTDGNGKFYLKNGQTAKFMTDIPQSGITYYVVEDAVPQGFLTPDFQFKGLATYGFDWTDENGKTTHTSDASTIGEQIIDVNATENKSYVITAKGSIESIDSLEFICVNYLNEELPNPTALAYEDTIVIDYGLPVHIDPLANDLYRGDEIEIVAWGDETLTLNEVCDQYGNAIVEQTTWTGGQTFHSGNVTFLDDEASIAKYGRQTFSYELTKQLTEVEVISYIVKVTSSIETDVTHVTKTACRYALAKIYIVPATIMYYEENFSDMITFTGSGWDGNFTVSDNDNVSDFQEPGVVGTIDDSTYGSDAAYLSDDGDSNGTYRFGKTTDGAIRFTYTFTGTGTSIFARTSADTGYIQVKVYEGVGTSGNMINLTYCDTYWKDQNNTNLDASGTLYNIPVFTDGDLGYGTYTVVCTVAKKGTPTDGNPDGAGHQFYLDGIRVMQPLNEESKRDDLVERALTAYATDGEANLDVVTLRQKLITDAEEGESIWNGTDFVVLTDIDGAIISADDYTSIGPKEEVYLAPGQTVSFSLKYWAPEGLKLYMGMKAPFGSAELEVGHDIYELKNAPDCYYDVTDNNASLVQRYEQLCNGNGYLLYNDPSNREVYETSDGKYFYSENHQPVADGTELTPKNNPNEPYYVVTYTFKATESIVSLTNIKVVGTYEFTILENTDVSVDGNN